MATYFMPSEIARLILGYFIDRGLSKTLKTFMQECPDLAEFYQVMKSGRVPPTTIMGQSLLDILNEFAELKLKAVRSGQLKVSTATSTECGSKEKDTIVCAREQVQETIKQQRLLWKERKTRQQTNSKRARKQDTATLDGDLVAINASVSSCSHDISAEDVFVSTPRCMVISTKTSVPASSEFGSLEAISTSAASHVTSPECTFVSVPSHVNSREIESISTSGHVTNPESTDAEPITSSVAEVENMPDILTDGQVTGVCDFPAAENNLDTQAHQKVDAELSAEPTHTRTVTEDNVNLLLSMPDILTEEQPTDGCNLPAAEANLDIQVHQEVDAKLSAEPSHARTVAEDNTFFLDWLLEETHFHEKLAENINKALLERDVSGGSHNRLHNTENKGSSQTKNKVGKGFNINQIIEKTESDPTLQNFLQVFQQGTAVPLSQFDVPVLNISSEVAMAGGQPGNTLLPAACKTDSSETASHSCKNVSVEPASYNDDVVAAVAPSYSVTSQPTTLLHTDAKLSSLLNPYDPETLDKTLPCIIVTVEVSETSQIDPSCTLKQSQPGDSHKHDGTNLLCQNNLSTTASSPRNFTVMEEYGSQKLTDLNLSSSSHLGTSALSQKCVSSNLHSVQDQVVGAESTGSQKPVVAENVCPQIQSSSLSAEKVTSRHYSVPTNENSLTVFSLIEKSIAEMNGEQFVHRSVRNSTSSQITGNADTHDCSSRGHRNEVCEHLPAVAVCNNTSREVSRREDIARDNNSGNYHTRTDNYQASDIKTGSDNTERSPSIPLDLRSAQNAPVTLADREMKENVAAFAFASPVARTNEPHESGVTCFTALPVCESGVTCFTALPVCERTRELHPATSCQSDYIAGKTEQYVTDVEVNTWVSNAAASSTVGEHPSVNQEERRAVLMEDNGEQTVIDTHQTCVVAPGLKNMCTEIEASHSLPKPPEQNKSNSTQSPGKKSSDHSCNLVCEENNMQSSRNSDQNCTLTVDCPETGKMAGVKETETNIRNVCVSDRELCVDNQERFCMSPPLRKPDRLQQAMAHRHTKKTCVNKPPEVKRSQSLCDCSAGSTSLDGQIKTINGNSADTFCEKQPAITSPPYFPLNVTDNDSRQQLSAGIHPQACCCSLPATPAHMLVPGSPNFSQSPKRTCNSSVKQAPQMTPPQGRHLHVSSTEENQILPKTVKRRVIAVHSEHSPFIPDHCKKNPSRRIVPKEVDYSTPSPLQDCPSSPMSYMVDVSLSQPNSPHNSKEGTWRPLSTGKTLPPVNGHVRVNPQRSLEASCHNEKSVYACGAQSQTTEGQQKVQTSEICLSYLDKLGIKLPPSPSKRKPRRINPVQLSASINKDWSSVTRSSSSVLHGGFSPAVDDARIVSSTSDITTSSEEEAFRLLKSFLSSSYSKPQPRQEITSTDQKTGASKCAHTSKLHGKHKGRGKKNPPAEENAVLTTTFEASDSNMPKKMVLVASDCDSTRRAESSCNNSINKVFSTGDSENVKGQPKINLCRSGENLPVKNSMYKVRCLHSAAHPAGSPCSHDSDMSFAAVGTMECFTAGGDKQVQDVDNCKMATASSSSSPHVAVCESIKNVPCLTTSKDNTSKGTSQTLCAPEELCNYQSDTSGASKICTKAQARTPEAEEVRFEHSTLTSVAGDKVSMASNNCASLGKSADGHYSQTTVHGVISAEQLTNGVETSAADGDRNVTAFSEAQTVTSPTVSVVADRTENKTCTHSSSTVKALSFPSSASRECRIPTSTDSLALKNTDLTVSRGSHFRQLQLHSHSQQKHCDSGSSSPLTNSRNKLLNVSDSVADAVYSLLSLVSSVDGQKADKNVFNNQVFAANKLSMKDTNIPCHRPSKAASVAMCDSLVQVPMESDVSLPSFLSSSLRLAHNLDPPFEVSTNFSSTPVKHCSSNCAGWDAKRCSENVCEVDKSKERLRPGSPSSISLLGKAMADCGIPFDGSNLTLLDTQPTTGCGVEPPLTMPHMQTPDPCAAADASVNIEGKIGRKPRSCARKPNFRNLVKIVPSLGVHNIGLAENNTVEQAVPSGNFVKILPRAPEASNEVLKSHVTDTPVKSSLLCQIQMIHSANGPIIIIPPGLEGIIQNVLSENELIPQASHTANNLCDGDECRQPVQMKSTKSLATSYDGNIPDLHPNIPTVLPAGKLQGQLQAEGVGSKVAHESGTRSPYRKLLSSNLSSNDIRKLRTSSADLHTTEKHKSDSLSSCNGEQVSTASNLRCVRKIAVRRRIDFTHLRSSKKRHMTTAKKKKKVFKTGAVADPVGSVKQSHCSNVMVAKSSKKKHTVKSKACKFKRNSKDYAVQSEKTETVYEVKNSNKDYVCKSNKTAMVCEDKSSTDYTDRINKIAVVYEDKKNSKDSAGKSETIDLTDEYNTSSIDVIQCKRTDNINKQGGHRMSHSEQKVEKCSNDRQLLSGEKSEVVGKKNISSCGNTKGNKSSAMGGKSAVSSLLALTKPLHERSKSQTSRNLKDKELSMCGDTSEQGISSSFNESSPLVLCAKSESLKPSKHKIKVKTPEINKKQPLIVKTNVNPRKLNTALSTFDSQHTVSDSHPDSSYLKSAHSVSRKRKLKKTALSVDQADPTFKRIKLQVPLEIKGHQIGSSNKSVRMVVDYTSGEHIVVGTLQNGSPDVFLTPRAEQKKQSSILRANNRPTSIRKLELQKVSNKKNIAVCKGSTTADKCISGSDTPQLLGKNVDTDSRNSSRLDECRYVGSVPFRSLFSIFDTIQGNQSNQPPRVPVNGSVQQTPEHPQCKSTNNTPSIAGKHHSHTTPKSRTNKIDVPCEKAVPEYQEHKNTSVPRTSRARAASQNRKRKSAVSTDGAKLVVHRKPEICTGGHDVETVSVIEVDCVSSNIYDNETQDAVASLELCMREANDEHIHNFHNRPGPLSEVSSQINIDDSSVILLEDSICQISKTSCLTEQLQPCNLNDVSPINLHLPPKKRLSSDFIVNETADTQVQRDHNSPVVSEYDSVFSLNKVTACQSHTSSVLPSEVLRDSSKPETVSTDIKPGAKRDEPLTEDCVLHSSQSACVLHSSQSACVLHSSQSACVLHSSQSASLYLTTQTKQSCTEVREETTDSVFVVLPHKEIHLMSVSKVLAVQPSHNTSIDNTLVHTDLLREIDQEQSPLSSCSLGEQHKQRTTSSPIASSDRKNPCRPGCDTVNGEPTLGLPSANTSEPCTVSESDVTLQTACIPTTNPAEFQKTHPVSSHIMGLKVDKLLRKLHKKKKPV